MREGGIFLSDFFYQNFFIKILLSGIFFYQIILSDFYYQTNNYYPGRMARKMPS